MSTRYVSWFLVKPPASKTTGSLVFVQTQVLDEGLAKANTHI